MHVELASRINREIDDRALIVLGKLEQDLVFGDATSKEVIQFLQDYQHIPATDKVLLTYPNLSSVTLALNCLCRAAQCCQPAFFSLASVKCW